MEGLKNKNRKGIYNNDTRNMQKFSLPKTKPNKIASLSSAYSSKFDENPKNYNKNFSESAMRPEYEYSTMSEDEYNLGRGHSLKSEKLDYISRSSNSRTGLRDTNTQIRSYMDKSISTTKISNKKKLSRQKLNDFRKTSLSKLSNNNDNSTPSQKSSNKYGFIQSQDLINKVGKYL
mmetsp:Transcript_22312/g.19813  ORF Transcript_22312/g.19813 Transcript_22312/m.19813 type:complete len:176 (-) Transcript_22312:24-551(-)